MDPVTDYDNRMRALSGDEISPSDADSPRQGVLLLPVKLFLVVGLTYVVTHWLTTALIADASQTAWGLSLSVWRTMFLVANPLIAGMAALYGWIYRPIRQMTRTLSLVRDGNYFVRAPLSGDTEFRQLAESFNFVLASLTDVEAKKMETECDLIISQRELTLKSEIAKKNEMIADTNSKLQNLVEDLSLLYDIGQGVNSTIELEELYPIISEMLRDKLKLQEFAILLFEEDRSALRVKVAHGFLNPDHIMKLTFRLGEGITGTVAELGEMIYVPDTRNDSRYLYYRGEKEEDGSFLSIPMKYKNEVLGVINFSRPGIDAFIQSEINLLGLIANQIALAIANAKLFTKTRELSVRDELTGLYNRRHFQHTLQLEWKRSTRFKRPISLVMIDVDFFKRYNDTFGHPEGDRVLKRVAQILMNNLREVDTVARFGGEEFVLLLPDTDKKGAIAVSEKLRRMVEAERFTDATKQQITNVTISLGIAVFPDDVHEMDDLIDHADIALYDAKDAGRNRVVCYPKVKAAVPTTPVLTSSSEESDSVTQTN